MEGTIANYRRGRHTQTNNQMIVLVEGINTKEKAAKFLNKKVIWKSPVGKEIKGLVTKEHGNKGALKVHFEKGMPGQSIGTKVNIG